MNLGRWLKRHGEAVRRLLMHPVSVPIRRQSRPTTSDRRRAPAIVLGAVKNGNCFLVNMTAGPLVEHVLGEPVQPCAGYAAFVERTGRSEYGFRWRPDKWAKWIDATEGAHVSPLQDIHCWLETATHIVDFTMGDTMGEANDLWPPLIFWPKWRMPRHPREARAPGSILLWRNKKALDVVAPLGPLVLPLVTRAFQFYGEISSTQSAGRNDAIENH